MSNKLMLSIIVTGVMLLLILVFGGRWITPRFSTMTPILQNEMSPSPIPYGELTIPHLRSRIYVSQLGTLIKLSEQKNYTSYLTSYDSDGFKVNGLLTIPFGEKPEQGWPAIVFVHGYIPPTQYKTTEKYVEYVDYLARNGFVVFKIDLRGHGESEGDASGAYYSSDYVIDVLNAYFALQNSDFVDRDKIGLWGHSMAGNVTFRSFVVKRNIPALVIWAGAGYTYQDLQEYRISDLSYRPPASLSATLNQRQKLMDMHGTFNTQSEFWKQVVPTNYLDEVSGWFQIHHALDDAVVSVEYSRNLMKVLDSTSIRHELFEYPGGGHNLTGSSFVTAMSRTVEFYNKSFGL